jgi:hypothetical protein
MAGKIVHILKHFGEVLTSYFTEAYSAMSTFFPSVQSTICYKYRYRYSINVITELLQN